MRAKRCRHCRDPFQPTRPMQTHCDKFECKSAAIAEHRAKQREKLIACMNESARPDRKVITLRKSAHSTSAPTKTEREWMDAIVGLGCIVCRLQGRGYVPAAVHHIKRGNRRMGHLYTIALCDPGHHQNTPASSGEVSRHPDKTRFETRYGTEMELLEKTKELISAACGKQELKEARK